jgi:hypothetical protein
MSEPTPRQVLYALVAGGFLVVIAVLVVGAAVADLVPLWWTGVTGSAVVAAAAWSAYNWRRTAAVLIISIGLMVVWTVGTLLLPD